MLCNSQYFYAANRDMYFNDDDDDDDDNKNNKIDCTVVFPLKKG
jgi:hypothetical protein